MEQAATTLVDKITVLLRTFIPGCFVVAALMITGRLEPILDQVRGSISTKPSATVGSGGASSNPATGNAAGAASPTKAAATDDSLEKRWIELSVIAFLIGILLYALHFLLLEIAVTWFTVWFVGRNHPDLFPTPILQKGARWMTVWLVHERWSRPVSRDPRAQHHQTQLDRHYAWLIFAYCMAYGAAFVGWDARKNGAELSARYIWMGGAAFLLGALIADYRITYYEAWLAKHLQQNGDIT